MKKQSTIAITLGISAALLTISASFISLQQQLAIAGGWGAKPAGSNMTGGAATANPAGLQLGKDNLIHVTVA